jgi:hypothetical protein
MAKLWAHVTDPPPMPRRHRPELVESFDAVVARATAKDPADRFATAGELAAALQAAVGEQEAKRQFEAAQPTRAAQGQKPDTTRDEVFVDRPPQDTPPGAAAGALAGAAAAAAVPAAAGGAGGSPPPEAAATSGGPAAPAAAGGVLGAAPPAAGSAASGGQVNGHRRRRWPLAAAAGLLLVAAAVIAAILIADGSSGGGGAARESGMSVTSEMAQVPFNKVYDAYGKVDIRLTGDVARVQIMAGGLVNGSPHLMHIHSGASGKCPGRGTTPSFHHGFPVVTQADGAKYWGHVVTSLTQPPGKTDADQLVDVAHYPKKVPITYSRSIDLGPVVAATIRHDAGAVVVIHGIDYNNNGRYDPVLARDDEKHGHLTIEETAPALCGELRVVQPRGGDQTATGTRVYTATLVPADRPPSPASLLCHLGPVTSKLF